MKAKIDPETLTKYLERFDVSRDEYDKDKRWQWAIGKFGDDDAFFLELKAERERSRAEIVRLKRRVNALLERLSPKREG
jgi:hypothetical protein